jgi:hypothetical protein
MRTLLEGIYLDVNKYSCGTSMDRLYPDSARFVEKAIANQFGSI